MESADSRSIEASLRRPVELELSMNDLRIIIGSIGAISYMARIHDEPYIDAEGIRLLERLQCLYLDEIEKGSRPPIAMPRSISGSSA